MQCFAFFLGFLLPTIAGQWHPAGWISMILWFIDAALMGVANEDAEKIVGEGAVKEVKESEYAGLVFKALWTLACFGGFFYGAIADGHLGYWAGSALTSCMILSSLILLCSGAGLGCFWALDRS